MATKKAKLSHTQRVSRADGWENTITGLGMRGKDKRTGMVAKFERMSEPECEVIYDSDELAQRIVDREPFDMMREGFRLVSPDLKDAMVEQVMRYYQDLGADNKIRDGMQMARQYGGAGMILGVSGIDAMAETPLDLNKINSLKYLTVLQCFELMPMTPVVGDVTSAQFGYPELYSLQPRVGADVMQNGKQIHYSRMIRFDGATLSRGGFRQNNYWHGSVFLRIRNALRNYHGSHDSVAALMQDFCQTIWKIKDLADIISSKDGAELIQKRIAAIDLARSVVGAVMIGEEEEFERKRTPVQGLKDLIDRVNERLVAATDMPHTVLLGESPNGGGLNQTGRAEERMWFDHVAAQQEDKLKPVLKRLFTIIFRAKNGPTKGVEPKNWDIEFNPLFQLSQTEILENNKKQAETDEIYINTGVLAPTEVAINRFATGEFSYETKLESLDRDKIVPPPVVEGEGEDQPDEDDATKDPTAKPKAPVRKDQWAYMADHYHMVRGMFTEGTVDAGVVNGTEMHFHDTEFGPTDPAPTGVPHIHAGYDAGGNPYQSGEAMHMDMMVASAPGGGSDHEHEDEDTKGKRKTKKTAPQAVIFSRKHWTDDNAKRWAGQHGFKDSEVSSISRVRFSMKQRDHGEFTDGSLRTVALKDVRGIKMVVGKLR